MNLKLAKTPEITSPIVTTPTNLPSAWFASKKPPLYFITLPKKLPSVRINVMAKFSAITRVLFLKLKKAFFFCRTAIKLV